MNKFKKIVSSFYLWISFFFFPCFSFAFESLPQISSMGTNDYSDLHGPEYVDSEYSSDLLTFQKSFLWDVEWLEGGNFFDTSVGSISSKRFLIQKRLRLENQLTEDLSFRILHLHEGDFEKNNSHFVFEFPYKLNSTFEMSLYGETKSYKSEDDIGISITSQISENQRLKLYGLWSDFSRNERNEQDDEFRSAPQKWGFQYLQNNQEQDFLQWDAYIESQVKWWFPQENKEFHYKKVFTQIKFVKLFDESTLSIVTSYSDRLKKVYELTPQTVKGWDYANIDVRAELQHAKFSYGIFAVKRRWSSQQGFVEQQDVLPYYWHNIYKFKKGHLHSGYELTWHRSYGNEDLKSDLDKDAVVETRWNLKYNLFFKNQSQMNILLTFDLDEFGSASTWEGGNIQFKTVF
ncbi:MAG: hypothetical protein HOO06_07010 [Bdellovibrionaceae bacterium]|jgi:hypothetical protein|nr:hypothetical protein [Pseudobdellovibrionaceae bacterium]